MFVTVHTCSNDVMLSNSYATILCNAFEKKKNEFHVFTCFLPNLVERRRNQYSALTKFGHISKLLIGKLIINFIYALHRALPGTQYLNIEQMLYK